MYHILVVDDEAKIREIIKKYAVFEGYRVTEAANGMEAIDLCRTEPFDLIIMDVMMPELDGFSACREIRKYNRTPIIMLSARGEEYDRIHGFELGIDDYVVKPFSPKELMMRVAAIIKRSGGEENNRFVFEGLTVDFTARLVFIDEQRIEMSPKEYDLFFMSSGYLQVGEAYDHMADENGRWRPTFMTFAFKDGVWVYCGCCFHGETVHRQRI